MKRVHVESSYHPGKGYHLDGASREIKMPRGAAIKEKK